MDPMYCWVYLDKATIDSRLGIPDVLDQFLNEDRLWEKMGLFLRLQYLRDSIYLLSRPTPIFIWRRALPTLSQFKGELHNPQHTP